MSRDVLVDMFWGEEDEQRARHSLSDALSHIRRILGKEAISARQADIELTAAARLGVDVLEFDAACDTQNWGRAAELYVGPFLDGVHVEQSARFDQWVTRERARLERTFLRACEAHCVVLARAERWAECAATARRWLETAPTSSDAAIYLINALKAPGTSDALAQALAEFDALDALLRREHEMRPDARVVELAARVREQLPSPKLETPPTPAVIPTLSEAKGRNLPSLKRISGSLAAPLIGMTNRKWRIPAAVSRRSR